MPFNRETCPHCGEPRPKNLRNKESFRTLQHDGRLFRWFRVFCKCGGVYILQKIPPVKQKS